MSDASFHTSTVDTSIITSLRTNVENSLAIARRSTVLTLSGVDATLSLNYDSVYVVALTAGVTVSLSTSKVAGDKYRIFKIGGTGALTIGRAGSKINGAAANISTSTTNAGFALEYSGLTSPGWFAVNLTGV